MFSWKNVLPNLCELARAALFGRRTNSIFLRHRAESVSCMWLPLTADIDDLAAVRQIARQANLYGYFFMLFRDGSMECWRSDVTSERVVKFGSWDDSIEWEN